MSTNLTEQEVKAISDKANEWALEDAKKHHETMATNSALNRGYKAGATEYALTAKDLAEALEDLLEQYTKRRRNWGADNEVIYQKHKKTLTLYNKSKG